MSGAFKKHYGQWLWQRIRRQQTAFVPVDVYRGRLLLDTKPENYQKVCEEAVLQANQQINRIDTIELQPDVLPTNVQNLRLTTKFWRLLATYFFK